jgi:hypothetical protein
MRPLSQSLRWWHIVMLVMVLVTLVAVAVLIALRGAGRAHYHEVIAGLKGAGHPVSVDDLLALAPTVDRGRQAAWDAWQKAYTTGAGRATSLAERLGRHQLAYDAWIAGTGSPPNQVEDIILASAADFAAALPPLRGDGLVLSGYGWMAEDLPVGRRRMPFTSAMRLPNLLCVRELALWLRHATAVATDPRPSLADLDALNAAMARPVTLIDAMIALALADIRDRTYVDLALLDRLPDAERQHWLAEPCRHLALLADAIDGESVLMAMAAAEMLEVESLELVSGWEKSMASLRLWITGHRDCARMAEVEVHAAQRLRGQRLDTWNDGPAFNDQLGILGRICMPNLTESAITALQADARHRMTRLAVMLIGMERRGGLPADQAALRAALGDADLLAPAGDHLHLLYEALTADRFRVVVDPASPLPDFDDPKRMGKRTLMAGAPPAKEPLVWLRGQDIELRVPTTAP